ncbi:hypothetical protein NQ317_000930 [Molorchus minor]|uniref:DAGKc domain-containing protein n=1 Tax=Molorchus minor TaxID=1323400 RepID=A0ABQ9K170_9CUCU|nr:hypothetical protein NQ317_000930 [Molorchus minor]
MSGNIKDSVLLSTFYNGKKKLRIIFHNGNIVWDSEKPPSDKYILPIENVISVHYNYLRNTHPSENREIDPNCFTIHYSERKYSKWVHKNLTLKHCDPLQVASWVKALQNHLQSFIKRPKHLLLFVNPFGGRRNALQIYEKYGKHLFSIAGVEVTVNISQRKDQIKDYIINHNLDMFDSIACVGGDGTLSELFNGLVLRECHTKGVDSDDINQNLPSPKIPVGIIPGGSTDTIAYCIHGTTDPTTAVLHIIFGDSLGLDLVSVYDEHKLLRLYASVLSYGYLGDVAYNSDKYRWMGPHRYDYSGFKKLLRNKGYQGEIAIYSESAEVQELMCSENCEKCELSKKNGCDKVVCKWQTISGTFFMLSGANISCACSRSPKGIAPYSHLVLIQVLWTCHLSEAYCAREFCFRAVGGHSRWNCDGEIQHQTNIRANNIVISGQVTYLFKQIKIN